MLELFITAVLAANSVLGTPIRPRTGYSVNGAHTNSDQWDNFIPAPGNFTFELPIGLKQSNFEELERQLNEVSDPCHSRYGQYLSREEVNDLIKPDDKTSESVRKWLHDNGFRIFRYSPAKDWIYVNIDVESAERLLNTKCYFFFENGDIDRLSCLPDWSLPSYLNEKIETIQTVIPLMRRKAETGNHEQFAPS